MRKKILVVEDDPLAQIMIMDQIKSINQSIDVKLASSYEDAIMIINNTNMFFDLVLIDYNLPNFDGPETMYKLNKETNLYNFVFITADKGKYDICIKTSLQCLLKPIDDNKLKEVCKMYGII